MKRGELACSWLVGDDGLNHPEAPLLVSFGDGDRLQLTNASVIGADAGDLPMPNAASFDFLCTESILTQLEAHPQVTVFWSEDV